MEQKFLGNDIKAIYLRGSYYSNDYPPQDLDVVVITDKLIDTKIIRNILALYFSNIIIDILNIRTGDAFLERNILIRSMICYQSHLIYGKDIFLTYVGTESCKETSIKFIQSYISSINHSLLQNIQLKQGHRSLQKKMIRIFGSFCYFLGGSFTRDLVTCIENIDSTQGTNPKIIPILKILLKDYISNVETSNKILKKVSDEINHFIFSHNLGQYMNTSLSSDRFYSFLDLFQSTSSNDFFQNNWDTHPIKFKPKSIPNAFNGVTPQYILKLFLTQAKDNFNFVSYSSKEPKRKDGRNRLEKIINSGMKIQDLNTLLSQETLIIRNANLLSQFTYFFNSVSHFWRSEGTLNCYLSSKTSDRFPIHQDAHQIFAYHTFGKKKWLLWPPTIKWPVSNLEWKKETYPQESPLEFICQPNEVLYIPTGWRHQTQNITDAVIHFSIGVKPYRWNELLHKMLDYSIAKNYPLRMHIPFEVNDDKISYLECEEDLKILLQILSSESTNQLETILQHLRDKNNDFGL